MKKRPKKFGYMGEWFLYGHYVYSVLNGEKLMGKRAKAG
jgi:hypothetical protein